MYRVEAHAWIWVAACVRWRMLGLGKWGARECHAFETNLNNYSNCNLFEWPYPWRSDASLLCSFSHTKRQRFIYDTSTPSPTSSSSSSSSLRTDTHINEIDLGVKKNGSGNISGGGNSPNPHRPHGLRTLLADYLRLGIVTIIPWTHAECDKVVYALDNSTYRTNRASCPPVSVPSLRSVALSSCYLR